LYFIKSRTLKIVFSVFAAAIMCAGFSACANSSEGEKQGETSGEVTDDFICDQVLVVLSNEKSLGFKEYTVEDFPDVELVGVEDLMSLAPDSVNYDSSAIDNSKIAAENYHQILSLLLKDATEEGVLNAVSALEKISWVESASPNYIYRANVG